MVSMIGFIDENPGVYLLKKIYKPNDATSTGNVVPRVGSLVIDADNNFNVYTVIAVNEDTKESTLKRSNILITNEEDANDLFSLVSYENDIFFIFYDKRTVPMQIHPDARFFAYGVSNEYYRIIRYPDTDHEEVISVYYDSTGTETGTLIPLSLGSDVDNKTKKFFTDCHTKADLTDGEEVRIEIYNAYGAEVGRVSRAFAREGNIVNENLTFTPVLTHITLESSQMRGNDEIYIHEKQDVQSLNLVVRLHYEDGSDRVVDIDGTKCRVIGLDEYVSSFAGLRQPIIAKYYLDANEVTKVLDENTIATVLSTVMYLVVIPNELAPTNKISVIPRWNTGLSKYVLNYFIYNLDREETINITPYVTISSGTFNGTSYGKYQYLTLSVDMQNVYPTLYTESTTYLQTAAIKLQPYTALERYILKNTENEAYAYGVDSSTNRRPVLHYDTTRQQYFVPTMLFGNKGKFLNAFYNLATPPYDLTIEEGPVEPTHFIVRDISTGQTITQAQMSVENYHVAFSVIGNNPNRYVGTNVIVEFLKYINETQSLILYGVPVDCYQSETGYIDP